jgi:Fe(3+) dicitrate transport protein
MNRAIFLLLFLISLNKNTAYAQNSGSISGIINDTEYALPLSNVEVTIQSEGKVVKGVFTDTSGKFRIEGIIPGQYELKVKYVGENKYSKTVSVEADKNIELKISVSIVKELEPIYILPQSAFKSQPGAASKISNQTLQQINPIGTQEALKFVPGVYGAADDGMGNSRVSIGIRGLNPRRSSRVLLLEDGIPIQPAMYVYPNAYYNPPVERVHEIEVIKGSGSIKYGPQTMGGVINYITNRPREEFGGVSQLMVGSNNYLSLFSEVGGWGTKKFNPEVQLLYKSGKGYRENNDFQQLNGTFKANFFFNEKKSLYLKYNINQENTNATYTGLTEYSFRTNPNFNPKSHDNFKVFRTALDLIFTHQITDNFKSTTKVYANIFDRKWWRENDVFVDADTYDGVNVVPVAWYTPGNLIRVGNGKDNFGNVRSFYVVGIERSYTLDHKLFKTKSKLEVGGRYYWDRFIDDKLLGASANARTGVYYIPDSTGTPSVFGTSNHYETTAFSGYVQEHWNATEKLSVVPGIRMELFEQEMVDRLQGSKYSDQTMFVLLPGIGINYELGKTNLFAGVHRGYTPPSSATLLLTNFGAATNGFDLESEKSWNYEIGMRGNFSFLSFETAGFLIDIEDVIVMGGPASRFTNIGSAVNYGVEHAMKLSASTWWKFFPDVNLSYTLLYTEVKSGTINSAIKTGEVSVKGKELPYAPRHTLVAGLSKTIKENFTVRVDFTYVSKVYTDLENIEYARNRGDTGPVPAYYLWDASMSYQFNEHWKVFAVGKNILDEVYIGSRLHSDPYAPKPGQNKATTSSGIIPGARRQINLGLRYEF